MRCSRCEAELDPAWNYCVICGLKIERVSYSEAKARLETKFPMIVDLRREAFPITEQEYQEMEKQLSGFRTMLKERIRRLNHE